MLQWVAQVPGYETYQVINVYRVMLRTAEISVSACDTIRLKDAQLWEERPDDLEGLDLVGEILAIPLREYCEHWLLIEYKGNLHKSIRNNCCGYRNET